MVYCNDGDDERTIRIDDVDEGRLEEGEVSWVSSVALALKGARGGDVAKLHGPQGAIDIEVLAVIYEDV